MSISFVTVGEVHPVLKHSAPPTMANGPNACFRALKMDPKKISDSYVGAIFHVAFNAETINQRIGCEEVCLMTLFLFA